MSRPTAIPTLEHRAQPGRCSTMEPLTAAMHIGVIHRAWTRLGEAFSLQLIECCWVIREQTDRAEGDALLAEHTPISPAQADRYAATWNAARRNRAVMDAALDRPRETVRLVSELAASDIDVADVADVAEIVALPPAKRNSRIKALIARERAASADRHPDDVARIGELEREAEEHKHVASAPTQRDIADHLTAAENSVNRANDALAQIGPPRSEGLLDHLRLRGDNVIAAVDRLHVALEPDP